jgi:hypothetical protein
MLSAKLKEAAGNSADATLYVDDVFSTWLYTGNSSTQTITNGIDLAGKGGMVWVKSRSAATNNFLFDTTRGVNVEINSNTTDANATLANSVTAFNSSGFALGSAAGINVSAATYASWTFRKAPKFFDVVTYTGNGTLLTVNHNLGSTPGMIIVKRIDGAGAWNVYHRGLTAYNYYLLLNTSDAQANGTNTWGAAPTSTTFTVGNASGGDNGVNGSGNTYVAYLYAHDTSSTGIIQCGSATCDSGGIATFNVGWQPQYILFKSSSSVSDWRILDTMRGWDNNTTGNQQGLLANSPVAETVYGWTDTLSATGGTIWGSAGQTFIYMAIRMPNKPPTDATKVFAPNFAYTNNYRAYLGQVTDMSIQGYRNGNPLNTFWASRLTNTSYIVSSSTDAEVGSGGGTWDNMVGNNYVVISPFTTVIDYAFKRAPMFFDVVCYTGTGVATTQAHNLTVVPELIFVKERSAVNDWWVYLSSIGNTKYSVLNSTAIPVTSSTAWNNTTPTASVFSIGTATNVNASAQTFVAYLFATLAGISKVGSYTGNGTGQAIACGFSGGARFVLIKRTDSTGNWYTFDSARGLTSGSSPYLLLNSTAAEVTGNNGVYASSGGFTLGSTASTTTNINAATYIFLAVA